MQPSHADRGHAEWSASATKRNWLCAGALAATEGLPDNTSREADWGTVCHEVAEKVLRGNGPADRYIGQTFKGKVYSFEFDEEMAECTQAYCDYVVQCVDSAADAGLSIEQHFSLASLKPPFEAGGTADAVIYYPAKKLLEVVDLKTGRGVNVDVKGNPQLRSYALGAMLANERLDVTHIKSTVIQPRTGGGKPKSETFHVVDLAEWAADLLVAMRRSREAKDTRSTMAPAEWETKYLVAGDHCRDTFCKARATCPAVKRFVEDQVGLWFTELDEPRLANIPNPTDPASVAQQLDALDLIEGWCNAVREHAHRLAESGVEIPGYILVPKQGREKWTDGADETVIQIAQSAGLKPDAYQNAPKLRTPKQVRAAAEKAGKKDAIKQLLELSTTPDAGTNLVKASKTTRQAVAAPVHQHFSAIE